MKNLFLEKNIVQKLIIALVIVILFNFASPTMCNAKGFSMSEGGKLLTPILELIMAVFDGILNMLQNTLMTDINIVTPATSDEVKDVSGGIIKLIIGLVVVVAAIAVIVVSGGTAIAAFGAVGTASGAVATLTALSAAASSLGTAALAGIMAVGGAAIGCKLISSGVEDFKGEYDFPTIVYTPFAIFSGLIPLFDINFFNPSTNEMKVINVADMFEGEKVMSVSGTEVDEGEFKIYIDDSGSIGNQDAEESTYTGDEQKIAEITWSMEDIAKMTTKLMLYNSNVWRYGDDGHVSDECNADYESITEIINGWVQKGYISPGYYMQSDGIEDYTGVQNAGVDNEKSLAQVMWGYYDCATNKTASEVWNDIEDQTWSHFDARDTQTDTGKDIIKNYEELKAQTSEALEQVKQLDKKYAEGYDKNTTHEGRHGLVKTYEKTNSAEVLQGAVARWYYRLRDLALVCLLVILIYIGIRIVLSSTAPEKAKYKQMIMNWFIALCILALLHIIMITTLTITEKITSALTGNCSENLVYPLPKGTKLADEDGKYTIDIAKGRDDVTPTVVTNFIGVVRLEAGIYYTMEGEFFNGVAYVFMYVMLVVQTCMFTWVYGKRVVYMAFLTIIAPLVAITYPIDKIGDGKSQAFDMWLKEYIFNALLQPIHLLIYTVLCGTAMDLVTEAPIYGIICLAFVVPAEKFIRKMFGFEKAQTPSALGGAAGAALAMSGIQRLGNLIRPDGKDDRDADKEPKSHRIRTASADQQQNMADSAERARNRAEGIRTTNTNTQTPAGDGGTSPAGDGGNPPPPGDGGTPPTPGDGGNPSPAGDGGNPPPPGDGGDLPPADDGGNPPPPAGDGGTPPVGDGGNPPPLVGNAQQATNNRINSTKFTSRGRRAVETWWDMQTKRMKDASTPKKWARTRRKIRRAAIGGALGFGTGLAMAATKMAMGANASDVITTTTAGAMAGYGIGSKGAQKAQEFVKMDATREAVKEGWFTQEELKKQYDQEARDKAKEDRDTRAIVREACPDNWKELLYGEKGSEEQSWFDYCYDYGLTDPEAIVAAYKYRNSAGFNEQFSGDGITEEERNAVALQAGKDIQRYGDVRNDYKKRTEMESMKRTLAKENENIQKAARQKVEIDKANQQAEAIRINQDQAALNAEMAADVDLQAEKNAVEEFQRAEEAARKEIEENEAKVAAEAEEIAKKQAELAQLKAQMESNNENGVIATYDQDIEAQNRIIMTSRDEEVKKTAREAIENLEAQKKIAKDKLHEESVELRRRKSDLDREIRNLKNNRTQKITDERKRELEEEVTRKREVAEAAQQTAQRIRQERYKAREDSLTARRTANSQPINTYEKNLDEMADSMAKSIMKQYDQAMDEHDIVTG